MSRLDRLICKELVGPWFFGVMIFSVLIFATMLLVRITDWVVNGVSLSTVFQLILLLLPGIVVKTFSMAMLLSTLLSFGRLSNDSEIVAIRAAGASLFRVMRPVLLFSGVVAALSFTVNEFLVPAFSLDAMELQSRIKKDLGGAKQAKSIHYVVYEKGEPKALIGALDFDIESQTLLNVVIVSYSREHKTGELQWTWVMSANELKYEGAQSWKIEGGYKLLSADGTSIVRSEGAAWPAQIIKPSVTPTNLLAGIADDLDVFSITRIAEEIRKMKEDPRANPGQLRNLEFGFYNKIALPLSVIIFALLGAPLGIRSHRAGVASGFAISIALSFAYLIIVNFMAVYSRAGQIPPYVASFTPVVIGLAAACVTIYKKNT